MAKSTFEKLTLKTYVRLANNYMRELITSSDNIPITILTNGCGLDKNEAKKCVDNMIKDLLDLAEELERMVDNEAH